MIQDPFLQYIFTIGKEYTPSFLPPDIHMGKIGTCFDTCVKNILSAEEGKYRYVEGLAQDPENPGRWLVHAWLTDTEGNNAYDPTWHMIFGRLQMPLATKYVGIEMDIMDVSHFMLKTGYQGIFVNHRRNRELALVCAAGIPNQEIKTTYFTFEK